MQNIGATGGASALRARRLKRIWRSTMKKYNFFELSMSILSWATWIAMFGLLLGGYWYAPMNDPDPLRYAIKGATMMRFFSNSPAMIISYIALALLFVANVVNHLIKLRDRDGHNVILQAIVLVYALPYIICLFVIGFPEEIAWYPFSFFLCYVAGGIADILFARFCSLDSEDLDMSSRRRKAHKSHAGRHSFGKTTISVGGSRSKVDDYVIILNNDSGIEHFRNAIMTRIRQDADVDFDHEINYYAICTKSRYDVKKRIHFADSIDVGVDLLASDLNWFYQYVIRLNEGDLFANTRKILSNNNVSLSDIGGAKGKYASIKSEVEASARRELAEKCDFALKRLKMEIGTVLRDETNCTNYTWIGTTYNQITDFMVYLKQLGADSDVVLSKKANIIVSSSQFDYALNDMLKNSFNLFVEHENGRDSDNDDYLDTGEPKRYVIIDSKAGLESLSTTICLYMGDKLDELYPDNTCVGLAQKLPVSVSASQLVTTGNDKYYRHIKVDIHFDKKDINYFRGFCIACNGGSTNGDYFEKGMQFFLAHDVDAVKAYLANILDEGSLIGLRSWDRSKETWDEDTHEGDKPVRFEPGEMTVEVHWEDLPDKL